VDALSAEEWSYLFGLFLADGSRGSFYGGRAYQGCFFLQGDEQELAERVMCLLERAGLCPKLIVSSESRMFEVRFYSVELLELLPDGWSMIGDSSLRDRFFESNALLTVSGGIPFLAGLLDGDGYCGANLIKSPWAKRCIYGVVNQWHWAFVQSKFVFLIGYVRKFIRIVSPKGGLYVRMGRDGFDGGRVGYHISFGKPIISALLGAGISGYSWKVARWLSRVSELQRSRSSYYRLSEAAQVLHVNRKTLWRWLKAGKVRYLRRSQWFYIPASEVQRLKKQRADTPHGT
jgi:hypothetical protein